MRTFIILAFGMTVSLNPIWAADPAKSVKVEFEIFQQPYFCKNNTEVSGKTARLLLQSSDDLDKYFGIGVVMRKKAKLIPKDHFKDNLVAAVQTAGTSVAKYEIKSVTQKDNTIELRYRVEIKEDLLSSAKYVSPILISIPKKEVKSVKFIEVSDKAEKEVQTIEVK